MVGPLELFARGKVFALGGDALEVIRVVLEAMRDVRCAPGCRGLCVPMLGLVRLREPGYDGTGQEAGAGGFRRALPSKPAVWRTYLLEKAREISIGKGGKGGKDLRREIRVGHCRSVLTVENQEVGTIDSSWRTSTMDALKAEIATKRKAMQDDAQGPSKYMRRGDLERLKAEREQKDREEGEKLVASQVSARAFHPLPL